MQGNILAETRYRHKKKKTECSVLHLRWDRSRSGEVISISTSIGEMIAEYGDYLVKYPDGRRALWKPALFEQMFELAE